MLHNNWGLTRSKGLCQALGASDNEAIDLSGARHIHNEAVCLPEAQVVL